MLTPKVYAKLYEIFKAGPFYPFSVDPNSRLMTVDSTPLGADEIHINFQETEAYYTRQAANNRQKFMRGVSRWRWEVRAKFNAPIITETFFLSMVRNPPVIPRDEEDRIQVTLELESYRPTHPPEQSPKNGSEAIFSFNATLTPF